MRLVTWLLLTLAVGFSLTGTPIHGKKVQSQESQSENKQLTPQPLFEQWVNPVTQEKISLRFDGQQTTLERGGKLMVIQPKPFDEAAVRAQLEANQHPMFEWDVMDVTGWRDMLILSAGTPQKAKEMFLAMGFPEKLWEDIREFHRISGYPTHEAGLPGFAQASGQIFAVVGPSDSPALTIPGMISIRLDDPAFKDNLLFHPTPEIKLRFEELNRPAPITITPPLPSATFYEQSRALMHENFTRVSARQSDGSLWLPPALEPHRAKLLALERAVLRPVVKSGKPAPWDSKFGGIPYRPKGAPWPSQASGSPLPFLAQIDLGVANRDGHLPDLPRKGLLQFFLADSDAPYEDVKRDPRLGEPVSRVVYWPEVMRDLTRLEQESPIFDPDQLATFSPPEKAMTSVQDSEIPTLLDARLRWLADQFMDSPEFDAIDTRPSGHRLGGHAMLINASMPPQENWQLLFQFDGDEMERVSNGRYMLGGWLGFFILESDLKNLDFSRVHLEMDAF